MVILKESEIPSCLTNGSHTSQAILEVTHVPFPGCSDQIAGATRTNVNITCDIHVLHPIPSLCSMCEPKNMMVSCMIGMWYDLIFFLRRKKVIWSLNKPLRKFQSVGFLLFDVFASLFGSLILRLILKGCYKDFCKDLKDEKMRDAFWVRPSLFWKQNPCKVWW